MTFYIVAFIVPFIAALQRYSVAYGYEGKSKQEAFKSARMTFTGLSFIVAIFVLLHFLHR